MGPFLGCSESCGAQIVLIKQASAWGVDIVQFMPVSQEMADLGPGPVRVESFTSDISESLWEKEKLNIVSNHAHGKHGNEIYYLTDPVGQWAY